MQWVVGRRYFSCSFQSFQLPSPFATLGVLGCFGGMQLLEMCGETVQC